MYNSQTHLVVVVVSRRVEWINQGEKRNAYIPARPDEYYGRLGQWISWDHFLCKVEDDDLNGTAEEGAFG